MSRATARPELRARSCRWGGLFGAGSRGVRVAPPVDERRGMNARRGLHGLQQRLTVTSQQGEKIESALLALAGRMERSARGSDLLNDVDQPPLHRGGVPSLEPRQARRDAAA